MGRIVFWLIIGALVILLAAPIILIATIRGMVGNSILHGPIADMLDPNSTFRAPQPNDIAFGGDPKKTAELAKRLRDSAAPPDEASIRDRVLHVAVVDGLPPQIETPKGEKAPPKVVVDLGRANTAAVLIVSPGPAVWRVENASPGLSAAIGVEGAFAFDIENGPPRVLSGFRIGAFGAEDAVSPSDYLNNTGIKRSSKFCDALRKWTSLYGVSPKEVRIFVFRAPQRINVTYSELSGTPQPRSAPTWTIANECRQFHTERWSVE